MSHHTNGFETAADLTDHFTRHQAEFVMVRTEAEYLALADAFLGGTLDARTTRECFRRNGDRLRYNEFTQDFGVLRKDNIIKTYYKANPAVHRKANNLVYFFAECRK